MATFDDRGGVDMPVAAQVYDRFDEDLRAFINKRVGNREDAEDILQDVYVKIYARIDTLEDRQKVAAWVYRVARNAVIDHYRTSRPQSELPEVGVDFPDPVEAEFEQRLSHSVRGLLSFLSPEHYEALYLTEYEGLTQTELAERLGLSLSGAKSRVQRARASLKKALLDCCRFELDARGRVVDYGPHPE
jgi:RNA polymerase sigma-70 factor (ECF subfamily)